jgi:hypothetical protein
MEPESPSPYQQVSAACPYPDPTSSSPLYLAPYKHKYKNHNRCTINIVSFW